MQKAWKKAQNERSEVSYWQHVDLHSHFSYMYVYTFSRHANKEEKSEIRERLEGIKKGKPDPVSVPPPRATPTSSCGSSVSTSAGTPSHRCPNDLSHSHLTNSAQSLSSVLAAQIAALKQKLGLP